MRRRLADAADSHHRTLDARRRGPAIDYVSPGVGTLGHLTAEVFAQKAGISGNVNVGTMTWTSALAQIRAGKASRSL